LGDQGMEGGGRVQRGGAMRNASKDLVWPHGKKGGPYSPTEKSSTSATSTKVRAMKDREG